MAKKKIENEQENRSKELFEALALMEKERGIPVEFMIAQIEKAIITGCKNTYGGNDDVLINIDPAKGSFSVYLKKTVVEEVTDKNREILLDDARKLSKTAMPGDTVGIKLDPRDFGRIAVQTARNIIRQGIRDGEKGQALAEYRSKLREIVTARVPERSLCPPASGLIRRTMTAAPRKASKCSGFIRSLSIPGDETSRI